MAGGKVVGTFDYGGVEVSSRSVASGTIAESGGQETVDSGGTIAGIDIEPGGAATVLQGATLSGHIVDDGTLTFATPSGGVGGVDLTSIINGAGAVVFAGGASTLGNGSHLGVASVSLMNSASVTLDTSLTIEGALTLAQGTTLDVTAGQALNLWGQPAILAGTITGAGKLFITTAVSLGGLVLGGSMRWNNAGTATQSGATVLGNSGGAAALIDNYAGATYDIVTDTGITTLVAGAGYFTNQGLFEKTGDSGISTIGVTVANTGTIAVSSGTLDLAGALTQNGALEIDGAATLKIDGLVHGAQTVTFTGSGGDLDIGRISGFPTTLSGFASGDEIDLAAFKFRSGETMSFVENKARTQGVLTISDGALHASLALFGQYVAAGFKLASDGAAGTEITFTAPPVADLHLAAHH